MPYCSMESYRRDLNAYYGILSLMFYTDMIVVPACFCALAVIRLLRKQLFDSIAKSWSTVIWWYFVWHVFTKAISLIWAVGLYPCRQFLYEKELLRIGWFGRFWYNMFGYSDDLQTLFPCPVEIWKHMVETMFMAVPGTVFKVAGTFIYIFLFELPWYLKLSAYSVIVILLIIAIFAYCKYRIDSSISLSGINFSFCPSHEPPSPQNRPVKISNLTSSQSSAFLAKNRQLDDERCWKLEVENAVLKEQTMLLAKRTERMEALMVLMTKKLALPSQDDMINRDYAGSTRSKSRLTQQSQVHFSRSCYSVHHGCRLHPQTFRQPGQY